jgi:hypothetical protein
VKRPAFRLQAAEALPEMMFRNMKKPVLWIVFLTLFFPLWAEAPGPSKPAAVLRFSLGKTGLDSALFAEAEAGIRKLIAERGRFAVTPTDLTLSPDEAALLFESLQTYQGDPASVNDEMAIGETKVPKAVYLQLAAAAVIVIPAVIECRVTEDRRPSGNVNYKVTLKTSFDFIKREGEFTRVTRLVETMGYDPDRDRAIGDAIKTIGPMFSYELASLQELKAATTILVLENGEAIIERGGKQGALLGAEYSVRGVRDAGAGTSTEREKGLIIVSEVTDDVSVGRLAYADADVAAGDAVEEVPRLGLEISPYTFALIPPSFTGDLAWYTGVRVTLAKAVYTVRPFLATEFVIYPFSTYQSWFPVRPFLGLELRFRIGRFELAALPMIGVEEWFSLSPGLSSTFMGFGLRGIVQAGLLVSRDIRVFLEAGYEYWFGNRQGYLAGGGISFKL